MLLSLLTATALMMLSPPAPSPGQGALVALFARDVAVSVKTSAQTKPQPTLGKARRWQPGACRSGLEIRLPDLPALSYDINWSRAAVSYPPGGRRVTLSRGAAPPTSVPVAVALTFQFGTASDAKTAAAAMNRLRTACAVG